MSYFTQNIGKKSDFDTEDVIVKKISIDDITPDENQVREVFNEDKLKELSDSIKERGILNPIHVRVNDDEYIILTGERRYRAAKMACEKFVPCIVHEEEMSEKDIRALQLIENLQRNDLSAIETAKGFHALKQDGLGGREIARALGVSEGLISQGLTVMKKLPQEWLKQVEDSGVKVSIKDLYAIAKEKNKNKKTALYQKMMEAHDEEVHVEEEKPKPPPAKQDFTEEEYLEAWESLKKVVRYDKSVLGKYISSKKIAELIGEE